MGWKYEVSLYKKTKYETYDYEVIYQGNNWWQTQWLLWVNRKHPCVRLVLR